jgi:adenylate cyclase class 2
MAMNDQEIEVKYLIRNLETLEEKLKAAGAVQIQPRVYEKNLRFDTKDHMLTREHRVLRLRLDTSVHLTYKGAGTTQEGVQKRQEIEFTVSDFETARRFLEALDYEVSMVYEKYRAVYTLGEVHITLDEMPFGNFTEIEGPNAESIHAISKQLGLRWEARILDSYSVLFERVRAALGLSFSNLTFENFSSVPSPLFTLDLRIADIES